MTFPAANFRAFWKAQVLWANHHPLSTREGGAGEGKGTLVGSLGNCLFLPERVENPLPEACDSLPEEAMPEEVSRGDAGLDREMRQALCTFEPPLPCGRTS